MFDRKSDDWLLRTTSRCLKKAAKLVFPHSQKKKLSNAAMVILPRKCLRAFTLSLSGMEQKELCNCLEGNWVLGFAPYGRMVSSHTKCCVQCGRKMMTKFVSNETTYMVYAAKNSSTKHYARLYHNQPVMSSADVSSPAL